MFISLPFLFCSKGTDDGDGGNDRKRGPQGGQTGPYTKVSVTLMLTLLHHKMSITYLKVASEVL